MEAIAKSMGHMEWFQEILTLYTTDCTLYELKAAFLKINSSKNNRFVEKAINSRLKIVFALTKYIPNFTFSQEIIERSLKLSGAIFDLQSMEEKEDAWFNSARYQFVRTLLRLIPKDKKIEDAALFSIHKNRDIFDNFKTKHGLSVESGEIILYYGGKWRVRGKDISKTKPRIKEILKKWRYDRLPVRIDAKVKIESLPFALEFAMEGPKLFSAAELCVTCGFYEYVESLQNFALSFGLRAEMTQIEEGKFKFFEELGGNMELSEGKLTYERPEHLGGGLSIRQGLWEYVKEMDGTTLKKGEVRQSNITWKGEFEYSPKTKNMRFSKGSIHFHNKKEGGNSYMGYTLEGVFKHISERVEARGFSGLVKGKVYFPIESGGDIWEGELKNYEWVARGGIQRTFDLYGTITDKDGHVETGVWNCVDDGKEYKKVLRTS